MNFKMHVLRQRAGSARQQWRLEFGTLMWFKLRRVSCDAPTSEGSPSSCHRPRTLVPTSSHLAILNQLALARYVRRLPVCKNSDDLYFIPLLRLVEGVLHRGCAEMHYRHSARVCTLHGTRETASGIPRSFSERPLSVSPLPSPDSTQPPTMLPLSSATHWETNRRSPFEHTPLEQCHFAVRLLSLSTPSPFH